MFPRSRYLQSRRESDGVRESRPNRSDSTSRAINATRPMINASRPPISKLPRNLSRKPCPIGGRSQSVRITIVVLLEDAAASAICCISLPVHLRSPQRLRGSRRCARIESMARVEPKCLLPPRFSAQESGPGSARGHRVVWRWSLDGSEAHRVVEPRRIIAADRDDARMRLPPSATRHRRCRGWSRRAATPFRVDGRATGCKSAHPRRTLNGRGETPRLRLDRPERAVQHIHRPVKIRVVDYERRLEADHVPRLTTHADQHTRFATEPTNLGGFRLRRLL
jgi:hypothetical protein